MDERCCSPSPLCTCSGIRYCKFCVTSPRVVAALEAAKRGGKGSLEALFEKNRLNEPQSSCSFAALPSASPYTLCTTCGVVFHKPESALEATATQQEFVAAGGCSSHTSWTPHETLKLDGLFVLPDGVTEAEESALVHFLDSSNSRFPGWKDSVSGKKKQDFGPQPNFKKRKVKMREDIHGMPLEFQFLSTVMRDFVARVAPSCNQRNGLDQPEQPLFVISQFSALEYSPDNCSNLDPHIDDTWMWGPRIGGVSLLSGCEMTFVSAKGEQVDVVLPRRWAFLLSGPSRYDWLHGIRTTGVVGRRLSITMRELEPTVTIDDELRSRILEFSNTYY